MSTRVQELEAPILERREPAAGHVELVVEAPALAAARPGQFAHVRTPGTLRRPISFSRLDPGSGTAGLLFRVVGSGTAWLAERQAGERLNLLGPLGRGFPEPPADRPWILVGGGVGIPPLYAQAQQAPAALRPAATAVLGARSRALLVMEEDFQALGLGAVVVTTDDGSAGEAGTVLGPLAAWLERNPGGVVYACGPTPMLRGVAELSQGRAEAYVALEQRMGCGVGACLACAVLAHGP
ncbi:MAG: dihydroorotate dehydrogenase electron transfer subunit, partial [Firmicutes bacterium]|nr:dihydroorotate dehydrogenase electron transfer subunit [Bacillota bacterium]